MLSSAIIAGGEILISGSITNGSISVTCIGASLPTLDTEQRRGEHTEFVAHSPEVSIPHAVIPRMNTAEVKGDQIMKTVTLSRKDIDEILHHCHWIAAKNGSQQRFLTDKYPGWSMSHLIQQLIASKAVVKARSTPNKSAHFSGYQARSKLTSIEISPN